jgi:hypothetical protein
VISFGISNGFLDSADSGAGSFAGTPVSNDWVIHGITPLASNSDKLTPRPFAYINQTFTSADYTTDTRAVTNGFTHIILEADVRQGEGWYRFKTGSAPLSSYSTNLPTPDDLTTTGHARLRPSQAVAIGSDNSPFTGSVLTAFTVSTGGTSGAEFSGSISRLAVLGTSMESPTVETAQQEIEISLEDVDSTTTDAQKLALWQQISDAITAARGS